MIVIIMTTTIIIIINSYYYCYYIFTGLIISICLPVRHNDQLQGITCLDISLGEILKEVIHLHHGHYSYAFISDYKGQTVSHPLMPDALNYGAVIYLDISQIERDAGVEDIIDDMKRFIL